MLDDVSVGIIASLLQEDLPFGSLGGDHVGSPSRSQASAYVRSRSRVARTCSMEGVSFYLLFRFALLKSVFLHFSLQSDFLSMWSSQHGAVAQTFDWTTRCIYYLTGMDGGTVLTSPPKLTSKDQHDGHCSTLGRDYRVDMPVRLSFAH